MMIKLGADLKPLPKELSTEANRIQGCQSAAFMSSRPYFSNHTLRMVFQGDADAWLVKGFVHFLSLGLSGCSASEIIALKPTFLEATGLAATLNPSRLSGFSSMLESMRRAAISASSGSIPITDVDQEVEKPFELPRVILRELEDIHHTKGVMGFIPITEASEQELERRKVAKRHTSTHGRHHTQSPLLTETVQKPSWRMDVIEDDDFVDEIEEE